MSGIIESIKVYSAKGTPGKELSEAKLNENFGLEGDFHARGGDRQVSLLCAETRDLLTEQQREQKERGLCFSRFKENITIRGLGRCLPQSGAHLEAGAVLEITGETKMCHKECPLYEAGKGCPLSGMGLFAKVVKGGIIRVGDKVAVKPAVQAHDLP